MKNLWFGNHYEKHGNSATSGTISQSDSTQCSQNESQASGLDNLQEKNAS